MASGPRRQGGGSPRADSADFRRAVDGLKESTLLSSVASGLMQLKRVGREQVGLCPFHSEKTASFTINDAKGFGHCFGCGWHGDHYRLVMDVLGCGFREAYQRIANADLPTISPQQMTRLREEDRLVDLEKEADARRFYKQSSPIAETAGETYLRARGITMAPPETVRFGMVPPGRDKETGHWKRPRPCIVCGCEDASGAIVGIQRIYFKNNLPQLGKADCKLSLGTVLGSALHLGPAEETIILAEGPEDGLSIAQEGPGFSVWVPFGTSMMPALILPPIVRKVIIAEQNNTAGRTAAAKAAIAFSDQGLLVSKVRPAPMFDDWNDQLRGAQS